jgi:Mg2+/Co2+ transporter CorB
MKSCVNSTSHHARLPVYEASRTMSSACLHVRRALARLQEEEFDIETFRGWLREPYFIPSGTSLYVQLTQFQATASRLGWWWMNMASCWAWSPVEDILEEIVGEFTAVLPGGQGANKPAA